MGEAVDLTTFKKAFEGMIVKSESSWNESLGTITFKRKLKDFSKEEVEKIINSGSVEAHQ